jgi:hypothetical protein
MAVILLIPTEYLGMKSGEGSGVGSVTDALGNFIRNPSRPGVKSVE